MFSWAVALTKGKAVQSAADDHERQPVGEALQPNLGLDGADNGGATWTR
jgi:hypothetical protein